MAIWTAEPRHDWPGGKYVGATCWTCGVTGFSHHKNGPRFCWPHWQEAERNAEWRRAKWEADMVAEFGPYTPNPARLLASPTPDPRRNDRG